jgi:hypothetical protein
MTDRELMQQALEALELLAWCENPATRVQVRKPRNGGSIVTVYPHKVATDAAAPLRERLAQPEQEPVGKIGWAANRPNTICEVHWIDMPPVGTKLYTTPPQRKPLTVEEIKKLIHPIVMADLSDEMTDFEIVRAIEAAHGIGEKK